MKKAKRKLHATAGNVTHLIIQKLFKVIECLKGKFVSLSIMLVLSEHLLMRFRDQDTVQKMGYLMKIMCRVQRSST